MGIPRVFDGASTRPRLNAHKRGPIVPYRLSEYCRSPPPPPPCRDTVALDQVSIQPNSLGAPPEEVLQVFKHEIPPTVVSCSPISIEKDASLEGEDGPPFDLPSGGEAFSGG